MSIWHRIQALSVHEARLMPTRRRHSRLLPPPPLPPPPTPLRCFAAAAVEVSNAKVSSSQFSPGRRPRQIPAEKSWCHLLYTVEVGSRII